MASASATLAPVPASIGLPSAGSAIRRKPQFVYKSPQPIAAGVSAKPLFYPTKTASPPVPEAVPSTSSNEESRTKSIVLLNTSAFPANTHRRKFDMGPPLPLYHPFGVLSSSLKPLDIAYTARHGLPPILPPEEPSRKSVGRNSKGKQSSSTDESELHNADGSATPGAQDPKQKLVSPRKKGGRGGAPAAKRKRKDNEDGDASYPAKRPRLPRGAASKESTVADSPPERISATPDDIPADKKTANRGGRRKARGGRATSARRRNSSGSEETELTAQHTENGTNEPAPDDQDGDPDATPQAEDEIRASPSPRIHSRPGSEPV